LGDESGRSRKEIGKFRVRIRLWLKPLETLVDWKIEFKSSERK
jgi:hypothetical protein